MRYHVVIAESTPTSLFTAGIVFPRAYHYSAESKARVAKLSLLSIKAASQEMWQQQAKMQAASFASVRRAIFAVSGASSLVAAKLARECEFVLSSQADADKIIVAIEGIAPQNLPGLISEMSQGQIELEIKAF